MASGWPTIDTELLLAVANRPGLNERLIRTDKGSSKALPSRVLANNCSEQTSDWHRTNLQGDLRPYDRG
jgi:hypothetical protein